MGREGRKDGEKASGWEDNGGRGREVERKGG